MNEKCKLEREFSELRMAIDDKQNEAITSASSDLARRKGYLEENLKLTRFEVPFATRFVARFCGVCSCRFQSRQVGGS